MRNIGAFVVGLLFSVGLVLGGMTQPAKVIGFLDVTGNWDPSLAMVMVGAIAVYSVAYRWIRGRRERPLLEARFQVPTRRDLDPRLVGGAMIFGAGWGLAGYCPGPGIVSLGGGSGQAALFVGTMAAGMLLFSVVDRAWSRRKERSRRAGEPVPAE